jgi:hypothetical protein
MSRKSKSSGTELESSHSNLGPLPREVIEVSSTSSAPYIPPKSLPRYNVLSRKPHTFDEKEYAERMVQNAEQKRWLANIAAEGRKSIPDKLTMNEEEYNAAIAEAIYLTFDDYPKNFDSEKDSFGYDYTKTDIVTNYSQKTTWLRKYAKQSLYHQKPEFARLFRLLNSQMEVEKLIQEFMFDKDFQAKPGESNFQRELRVRKDLYQQIKQVQAPKAWHIIREIDVKSTTHSISRLSQADTLFYLEKYLSKHPTKRTQYGKPEFPEITKVSFFVMLYEPQYMAFKHHCELVQVKINQLTVK